MRKRERRGEEKKLDKSPAGYLSLFTQSKQEVHEYLASAIALSEEATLVSQKLTVERTTASVAVNVSPPAMWVTVRQKSCLWDRRTLQESVGIRIPHACEMRE